QLKLPIVAIEECEIAEVAVGVCNQCSEDGGEAYLLERRRVDEPLALQARCRINPGVESAVACSIDCPQRNYSDAAVAALTIESVDLQKHALGKLKYSRAACWKTGARQEFVSVMLGDQEIAPAAPYRAR